MIAALLAIPGRLKVWLIAAAAAIGALLAVYWRARAEGKRVAEAEQAVARDELRSKYDAIDREPVDVGGAYDRLRGMSDGGRR